MLSAPALKSDISPFRIAHTSAQTALDPKTSIQPQINKYVSFTGNSLRQFLAKHPPKFTQPLFATVASLRLPRVSFADCRFHEHNGALYALSSSSSSGVRVSLNIQDGGSLAGKDCSEAISIQSGSARYISFSSIAGARLVCGVIDFLPNRSEARCGPSIYRFTVSHHYRSASALWPLDCRNSFKGKPALVKML